MCCVEAYSAGAGAPLTGDPLDGRIPPSEASRASGGCRGAPGWGMCPVRSRRGSAATSPNPAADSRGWGVGNRREAGRSVSSCSSEVRAHQVRARPPAPGKRPPRPREKKKGRRRPTLARAGPALPSAMGRLTSVFGMGTGMTASPWPPARKGPGQSGTKENYNSRVAKRPSHLWVKSPFF